MSTNRTNRLLHKKNNCRLFIDDDHTSSKRKRKYMSSINFRRKKKIVSSKRNNKGGPRGIEFSDNTINSSEYFDSPNCSDQNSSDSDSKSFSSLNSDISSLTEDSDNFEVSLNNKKNTKQLNEIDSVSLSSFCSFSQNEVKCTSSQECAVTLCNQRARNQFDKLFYINFPLEHEELCKHWWVLCNRKSNFDCNAKICSIHFDDSDFMTNVIVKNGKRYRQTVLKGNTVIPRLYLLPEEYLKFSRKREKHKEVNNAYNVKNQPTEDKIKCSIPSCRKIFPQDSKNTIFFKYPLDNKPKLEMWMSSLKISNWKPKESDYICSNHFEKYQLKKKDDGYELSQYAIPSLNVEEPFILSSKICQKKFDIKDNHNPTKQPSIKVTFNQVSSDCLMVNEEIVDLEQSDERDKKLENVNATEENVNIMEDNSAVMDSKNNLVNNTLQSFFDSFTETLISPDTLKTSNDKEDLEYVYLDILDENYEVQDKFEKLDSDVESAINHNVEIEKKKTEDISNVLDFELEENKIYEEYPIDHFDMVQECVVDTFNNNDPFIESPAECFVQENEAFTDTFVQNCEDNITNNTTTAQVSVPEKSGSIDIIENSSKSTYSEQDYIYLDVLNSDNDGNSPPQICSTLVRKEILELYKEINPKEIPESIIYDVNLGESVGKMLSPRCDSTCQLLCYCKIPAPERVKIYKKFHLLNSITEQNCEIAQWLQVRIIKRASGNFDCCPTYCLPMGEEIVTVCRSFFLNTLGITIKRLNSILNPVNYNWYYNKEKALKANEPVEVDFNSEPTEVTDFMKESLSMLDKDYNMFIPDYLPDVPLDEIPSNEYQNVISYIHSVPRILTSHYKTEEKCKIFFETSINVEFMYKNYSEKYLLNKKPPPCTKRQFIKIYNIFMKKFV